MSIRVHFSLNPRKATKPSAFDYPPPPASSWVPSVQKSTCLALGFPWGAWTSTGHSKRKTRPTLKPADLDATVDKGAKPQVSDLVQKIGFMDTTIWRWAHGPGRTLIWIIPPPTPPGSRRSRRTAHTALVTEWLLGLTSSRANVVVDDETDGIPAEYRLPNWEGWWDLLGPMYAGAHFHVSPTPAEVTAEDREFIRLNGDHRMEWRIIGSALEHPEQGPALVTPYGEGKVVLLLARTPEDEKQGERLKEVVQALHDNLWASPSAIPAAAHPRGSEVHALEHGLLTSGSGNTITLREIADRLTDRTNAERFLNKTWTEDSVRHRLDRAAAENRGKDLFADIAAKGYEVNGRTRYPTGPVLDILGRYLASWDEEVKQYKLERKEGRGSEQSGRDLSIWKK